MPRIACLIAGSAVLLGGCAIFRAPAHAPAVAVIAPPPATPDLASGAAVLRYRIAPPAADVAVRSAPTDISEADPVDETPAVEPTAPIRRKVSCASSQPKRLRGCEGMATPRNRVLASAEPLRRLPSPVFIHPAAKRRGEA